MCRVGGREEGGNGVRGKKSEGGRVGDPLES